MPIIPTPHPHAALMLQYAKEAAIDQDCWKNWEIKWTETSPWRPNGGPIHFVASYIYRKKPAFILINGIEVPTPLRWEDILEVTEAHYPCLREPTCPWLAYLHPSKDLSPEKPLPGIYHLTPQAATLHANALLSLTTPTPEAIPCPK